jgi:hypothetical protein
LFLVDKGRSNLTTDILSAIFKVDSVYKAKDLCDKDVKEAKAQQRYRKADLAVAEEGVLALQGFEGNVKARDGLHAQLAALEDKVAKLTNLSGLLARHATASGAISLLEEAKKVAEADAKSLSGKMARLQEASRLLTAFTTSRDTALSLNPVAKVARCTEHGIVHEKLQHAAKMDKLAKAHGEAAGQVTSLSGLPNAAGGREASESAMHRAECTRRLQKDLEQASGNVTRLKKSIDSIPTVGAVSLPDLVKVSKGKSLVTELKASSSLLKRLSPLDSLTKVHAGVDQEGLTRVAKAKDLLAQMKTHWAEGRKLKEELDTLKASEDAVAEALSAFGACPACNRPFHGDAAHV